MSRRASSAARAEPTGSAFVRPSRRLQLVAELWDVVVYRRISKDRHGRWYGVESQLDDITEAAADGWERPLRLVGDYCDNDKRASFGAAPRPEFQRLCADVFAGKVSTIVATAHDRLFRTVEEWTWFRSELERRGLIVTLLYLNDRTVVIDPSTGGSDIVMTDIRTALAEDEIRTMKRRANGYQRRRLRAGQPSEAARRRYGYTRRTYEQVPDEAAIIREIAKRLIAGEATAVIARDLTAREVHTSWTRPDPDGEPVEGRPPRWSRSTVRQLLLRPDLAGLLTHKGIIVGRANIDEPILDEATWRAVASELRRRAVESTPRHKDHRELLVGLIRNEQGDRLTVGKNNARSYLTSASTRHKHPDAPYVSAPIAAVDEVVVELVLRHTDRHPVVEPTEDHRRVDDLRAQREELAERITEADRRLALPAGERGRLTWERYDAIVEPVQDQLDAIDTELAEVSSTARPDVLDLLRRPGVLRAEWEGLEQEDKRAVLAVILDSVILHPSTRSVGPRFDALRLELVPSAAAAKRWKAPQR